MALPINEPETPGDFNDIRWFLLHEGISVFVEDGDWYVQVDNPCKALTSKGLCSVYENRPRICRKYNLAECEHTNPDGKWEVLFKTPEDCTAYEKKYLREKRRKAARRRRSRK